MPHPLDGGAAAPGAPGVAAGGGPAPPPSESAAAAAAAVAREPEPPGEANIDMEGLDDDDPAVAEAISRHSALKQQLRGIAAEVQAKRRKSGDGAEPAAEAADRIGEQATAGVARPP